MRAPLDVSRDGTTVQALVWRPFALSKEKVTGGLGSLNLLHFAKNTARQTNSDQGAGCRIVASWQPVCDVDSAVRGARQHVVVH